MPKKKELSTKRGQHHQYKSFCINLVKDINLTKIDTNVVRKHPDSFEKKKVRLEKRNSDPLYFRQTICQEFPSLSDGVEFSFWRLSKDNPNLIPLPPEIDNSALLCSFEELNRSSLYIRLQAPPHFVTPSNSSATPHQFADPIDHSGKEADESSVSQGTNELQAVKYIPADDVSKIQMLNQSSWIVTAEVGSDGELLILPMSQASSAVAPISLQPTTTVMEDVIANKDEMSDMLTLEQSFVNEIVTGSACSLRLPKKRKMTLEPGEKTIEEMHQSSSAQGNYSSNDLNDIVRNDFQQADNTNNYNFSTSVKGIADLSSSVLPTPTFAMPQIDIPQLGNNMPTRYPVHRSMNKLPDSVSNLTHAPYFSNFTDCQYSHQQQPYIALTSLNTQLQQHFFWQQTQQTTLMEMNTPSKNSQEQSSNGSNIPKAQRLGEIVMKLGYRVMDVAAMNGKVYVACQGKDKLFVYNSNSPFQKENDVKVSGMKYPHHISAYAEKNCLFISDGEFTSSKYCIWSVILDGDKVVCEKFVEDIDSCNLSVTRSGELLIVDRKRKCLHLHNSDGRCFCCVKLPDEMKFSEPPYAVKSLRESFYVSVVWTREHDGMKTVYGVVYEVSMDGDIVKTFGGRAGCGSGQLSRSDHPLAVDKYGRVIVGDEGNGRILMLDSNLQLLTTVIDKGDLKDVFKSGGSFYMDDNADLIFVVERWAIFQNISVFDLSQLDDIQSQPNPMSNSSRDISSRSKSGANEFHMLGSIDSKGTEEFRGVATLMDSIYVLDTSSITVYNNTNPYTQKYLKYVGSDLWDIAANASDGCLYVTDKGGKCVWSVRIDLRARKWLEGIGSPYTLSVTNDGLVLILSNRDKSLDIHDVNGRHQHKIKLSRDTTMYLRHAVKLSYTRGSETYLVCHGLDINQDATDDYDYDSDIFSHEIFVVSANGDILQTFGGKLGSNLHQLHLPSHVILYKDGTILVADCKNNRVLRLDHELKLQNIPLSKNVECIYKPFRLSYNENTDQVIIANSNTVDIFIHDDVTRCQSQYELSSSDPAVSTDTSEPEMPRVQLISQVDIQMQKDKECIGAAVLKDRMYLIYELVDTVYVHSSDPPYQVVDRQELTSDYPKYIVASVEHNCVYIASDDKILRLLRNGNKCETFLDDIKPESISVTEEGHLLVATCDCGDVSLVITYDADGRCTKVIHIQQHIKYAVKSGATKVFINSRPVFFEEYDGAMIEVFLNGLILHTYGPYFEEYFCCIGMTKGEGGHIFVMDKANGGKILVFGSRARLIGELLSKDVHQMEKISGLCYLKDKKQLVVIGSNRIVIYQLSKNRRPQMDGLVEKAAIEVENPVLRSKQGDSGQLLFTRTLSYEDGRLRAIDKLRDKIYMLYDTFLEVCTRQDLVRKAEFRKERHEILVDQSSNNYADDGLWDIALSEIDLCVYITDRYNHCVWSVTIDHKKKKFLTDIGSPYTLSVTEDGCLCILSNAYKCLDIYDRNSNRKKSIRLPLYMKYLLHAVQTPNGTYIISWTGRKQTVDHMKRNDDADTEIDEQEDDEEDDDEDIVFEDRHKNCVCSGISETQKRGLICEVSLDGSVLRSFCADNPQPNQIDSCDSRHLFEQDKPCHLAVDREGRVFVADYHHSNRVLLLDSQLKFLANLTEKFRLDRLTLHGHRAKRLCYDQNKKELLVVHCSSYDESVISCIRIGSQCQ